MNQEAEYRWEKQRQQRERAAGEFVTRVISMKDARALHRKYFSDEPFKTWARERYHRSAYTLAPKLHTIVHGG